jgi:hypothetical protein
MEEHLDEVADCVRGPDMPIGISNTEVVATFKAAQESARHSPQ